jgi:fibronectin-binding autotransporter adhesin
VPHDFKAVQQSSRPAVQQLTAVSSRLRWATTRLPLLLLALAVACLPSLAFAQTSYFWNGGDPTASPAAGGTGTWDSATGNWRQGSDTGTAVAWPAAGAGTDAAIFAGTAGTVTLSGTQTANQLGFDVTGYTLTGGTLALDGTAPAISVISGTATVGSAVSGSAGLVKTGDGTLVLSAANNFSGDTTISAGTLQLNAQAAASNGLITLGNAATGTSDVQLTLNTNIDRSGFTNDITVANQGTGTATIKWIETGVTGNPSTGNGLITLDRATIFDATQIAGGAYIFDHALSGAGDITLTGTNGTRFLLDAASPNYTGDITIQSGGIFEPRSNLSSATGNSVTVASGGELRIQFATSSIGGLNGDGIVQSVSNAQTLTVGKNDASGSFAGILRNNPTVLSFTKTGTGTQILSGANTYTGATTISGGTLQIGAGGTTGTLGSGAVSIGTGSTLAFDRSGGLSVANAISGNGSLVQSGAGAVSLTGTNTYAGGTTVTAGILGFSGQASIPGWGTAGAVTVGAGGALAVGNDTVPDDAVNAGYLDPASGLGFDTSAGDRTWSTAITGTRPFVKAGANTLTLTAVNTHSGLTTIGAGILELQSNANQTLSGGLSGGGTLRKSGTGTLTLSGTNSFTGGMAIDAGTLVTGGSSSPAGTLSGSGDLVKTGSDLLAFSSGSGFTGAATVVAGTLQLGGGASPSAITLGTADTGSDDVQITLGANTDRTGFAAPITVSNQGTGAATIKWIETGTTIGSGNGLITLERATTFDATQFAGGYFLVNHALSGAGDITLTGTNGTRFLLEAASPNYTGDITVQSGGIFEPRTMLSATSGNNLTIDTGGVAYFLGTATVGGLNGAGNVSRSPAGNGTISVGKGDASGSFSGSITTGVALVKTGTGTQVLSGASSSASGTTVVAGTLQISSTSGAGTGAITLGTAATGANDVRLTLGSNADRSGFSNPITVANQGSGSATIKWIETGNTSATGNGTITLSRAATFDTTEIGGAGTNRYLLFNHALAGAGDITLTDTNGTRFLLQAASAGYTGNITVQSGGILEARNNLSATTGNSITVDSGGQLRIQFEATTIGGLNGSGSVQPVNAASGTLTIGKGDAGGSFAGPLSGSLTLTKTGAGTQVFSGASTYTGGTTINAGTLKAANNAALGTGGVTIANGATLRVAAGTSIANTLSLAGSTLELESPEALGTVAGLIAGTSAAAVSLTPAVAWSPQVAGTTYSDVLGLTNTAGTVQILEIAYDPSTLGSIAPADLFLGWDDNGDWVNAIDGNSGSVGGSAVFDQTGSLTSLGILATNDFLGSWGRDTTANTAWAVIDHNSDFAAIAVPEPATLALAGVAAATLGLGFTRRRLRRPEVR